MISFVWSGKQPFLAGRGGSENYTAGQIRELKRRGIPTRIITLGHGEQDGRDDFPDIQFKALDSPEELSMLDDTLVFVTYPLNIPTKHPSYAILHCPKDRLYPGLDMAAVPDKYIIAPSRFAARCWGQTLHVRPSRIPTVYPFAETCFGTVQRPEQPKDGTTRILFAGRLLPDKGIYTLLAAMHMDSWKEMGKVELTVTDAASDTEDGQIILQLLKAHPKVTLMKARKSPEQMAELMARHDIVVMPTTNTFWLEMFGIVSVEAQHAGCRVVASDSGGLPETDCGGLLLVKPDDPGALASGIAKAAKLGPLTSAERAHASTRYTVRASVDSLLHIMAKNKVGQHTPLLTKQGALVRKQLDAAIGNVRQLGLGIAGENELTYQNTRITRN